MPTFDGNNLIMTLDAPTGGVLTQDVEVDWYNAWKDWMLESPLNRKYPPLFFDSFGGNNIVTGLDAGAYFIFQNNRGWRLRPFEADQTIYVTGSVVPSDSSLPITIPTIGGYTVMFDGLQQQTQVVESTSNLTAADVWSHVIEGTFTAKEVQRLVASAAAAKVSGAETTTMIFRDLSDSKPRITATVDENGNRTAITYDAA